MVDDLTRVAKHPAEYQGACEQSQAQCQDAADVGVHVEEEGVLESEGHPADGEKELIQVLVVRFPSVEEMVDDLLELHHDHDDGTVDEDAPYQAGRDWDVKVT